MLVDEALVRHIARLARLEITDQEAASLPRELSAIFDWVEQLKEVDVSDVEPLARVAAMRMRMREDKVTDGGYADDILKNAPISEDHFFMVPKVLE
jgi:aspartyl-tRNA(Asn)/glutamyl-tRNA(Gln) amidotransferase subunit C